MLSHEPSKQSPPSGSQTLARGLRALVAVVESPDGMTIQQLAAELSVHRSIAYRLLQTLSDFGFVVRAADGAYWPGARLAGLSTAYLPTLRRVAIPTIRHLSDQVGYTVGLFIAEGDEAVSIELVEPLTVTHHIAFRAGMRTPIDRGAAGYALLAAGPAVEGEPEGAARARELGYATSAGEVEAGAYAIAASIPHAYPAASLMVMSYREDHVIATREHIIKAAAEIGAKINAEAR
jgi:DNA-binding IclR family transcriptional regulator